MAMSVNYKVLQAFTGKTNPIVLTIKGTIHKALIDFAEIRLPKSAIKTENLEELENEFDCVIRGLDDDGLYLSIFPKFIFEFKVLCSESENQTNALAEWLKTKGAKLIRVMLGHES